MAQEHDAAAHAGADPSPWVAEDHCRAAGHVFERKPAKVAAEHDLRARETDRGARIGATLHQEPAALRAVREAFPDGSVDEPAGGIARFQDRHGPAERGLRGAVLGAAAQRERDAVGRVSREAVACH